MRDMSVVDCDPSWPEGCEGQVSELHAVLDDEAVRTESVSDPHIAEHLASCDHLRVHPRVAPDSATSSGKRSPGTAEIRVAPWRSSSGSFVGSCGTLSLGPVGAGPDLRPSSGGHECPLLEAPDRMQTCAPLGNMSVVSGSSWGE